ncbi:DUF4238 domain-containing protein [Vibrio parahaemolyticus]|uniref:DUF4238 domain-containing protein n=2 Tax=Vibrio parahaemolyticus TaxID=670 RepID=UPI0013E999DD|nr:DUF4238 domain-containing protein [Vibrio parahaemolyticus]MDF5206297.1 DUF4238 domain-containing protein [Vibrio parahaemolyticus]MDF5216217.1 DUF4238 domain-containing protein [Vibrio parahaemolyticus]HBC3415234.1 DUF4238 domain-containing protein [Vibrio parahaemolyticus]HBC3600607.1 DUF4238 domain-containing protein [Vibrio parahaemolyticus]HBC3877448.1 DUF4238 domain-containing protein [Vibrio parahaemolyticus]
MSKKKNKEQHYVSACHLYNFTNEQQRKTARQFKKCPQKRDVVINYYDIFEQKHSCRSIKNIATESYLFSYLQDDGSYNHDVDNALESLETKVAKAFDYLNELYFEIIDQKASSIEVIDEHIDIILEFVSWQWKRDPLLVNRLVEDISDRLNTSLGEAKAHALDVLAKVEKNDDRRVIDWLKKRNIMFIMLGNDDEFILPDRPFVRFNPNEGEYDGLAINGTEIYFPISPKIMLTLLHDTPNKFIHMVFDSSLTLELNQCLISKAEKYIFYSDRRSFEQSWKC